MRCSTRRSTIGLFGLLFAAVTGSASAVQAEVTLETRVQKVETLLEGGGRVKRELVPVEQVLPGEELRYTITFENESERVVDAGRIVIVNPIPEGTRYVADSAGGTGSVVEVSRDGANWDPEEASAAAAGSTAAPAPAPGADPEQSPAADSAVESIRWTFERNLAPGDAGTVFFHVRME